MNSLEPRARAVRITFWLLIVIYAGAFLLDAATLSFLSGVKAGAVPDQAYAESLDRRQSAFGIAQLAILIACAVAFCSWFAQAHRNLSFAGAPNLKYSPGWAIVGFFVPFLNLVRPYQVMKEVWAGSLSLAVYDPRHAHQSEVPSIVGWWWGLFLVSSFLDNAAGRQMLRSEELDEIIASAYLTGFADLFNLPAAFVALKLVGRLTALQERVHDSAPQTPSIA